MRSTTQAGTDRTFDCSRFIRRRCTFAAVSTVVVLVAVPPARTFVLTPKMSSPSKGKYARKNRIGRSSPFEVVSSSGSTVQGALQALRESYALEDISNERSARDTSSSLGLVFYTRFEHDKSPHFLHDIAIRKELGLLHGALPWIDHMIASPALATSTAEHGEEADDFDSEEPSCYVTLVILDNPGVKVTPFVLNPDCQLPENSSLLQDEEVLGLAVVEALESCASDAKTSFGDCSTGQFDALCLAYGVESAAGKSDAIVKLRRLNEILRGARLSRREDPRRCPLIASVTNDTSTVTYVSTRNRETGELRTLAAGLAGAVVHRRSGSMSRFQVVHAGNHASIRGSQFRIKRMQGSKIAEVTPVRSLTSEELRRNCGVGVTSAAEWCRHTVFSSSRFEKMAMQAALGVGILRRMVPGVTHSACSPDTVRGDNQGFIPCLPAETCIDIAEVGASGFLNLMMPCSCSSPGNGESSYGWRSSETEEGPTVRGLQSGDLCDFRTVGSLASLQAERDAFAWFHATRLGASMAQGHDGVESRVTQNIQGCLAASAASRFAEGFEKESCDTVARLTADHGLCHSACLVPSKQIVSMDNEMITCTANACLACVYICGEE